MKQHKHPPRRKPAATPRKPTPSPPVPPASAPLDQKTLDLIMATDLANIVKKVKAGKPLSKSERELLHAKAPRPAPPPAATPGLPQALPAKPAKNGLNKRTDAQRAADLVFIERLVLRGWRHCDIAEELAKVRPYHLSRVQITLDVQKLEKQWLERAATDVAAERAAMIQRLEEQRRELWKAWEKSKRDAETRVQEQGDGTTGGTKQRVTTEGQSGNPAFHRLILDIDERLAKLRGMDAPIKTELAGVDGGAIQVQHTAVIVESPIDPEEVTGPPPVTPAMP